MRLSLCGLVTILGALVLTCASCATHFGYGRVQPAGDDKTIEELVQNREDYRVFYSGIRVERPSGLMFDPRHDDRELEGRRWKPVPDRETLERIVAMLRANHQYWPIVSKIVGPKGFLYGYVYTGWDHVVARAVDSRTMYLLDLPSPLPDRGREGSGR